MIRILIIIKIFIFLINNASSETISAELKNAYNDNPFNILKEMRLK